MDEDITREPLSRICPKCSSLSVTDGQFCPHCGASYLRTRRRMGRRTVVLMVAVAVLVAAGAAGLALKRDRDADARAKQVAAFEQERRDAAASAVAAKEAADDAERARRKRLVAEVETTITKDANARIRKDELDGPKVTHTRCTPLGGGNTDDLTAITGAFSCTAVNEKLSDGSERGYRFSATINYDTEYVSWHLG